MAYAHFFERITGFAPYPYQQRLGAEPFPKLLDVPTGLGKTAAVSVAWMYKRLQAPDQTPRRLVYCLPMRTLVEQTHQAVADWLERVGDAFASPDETPTVHRLMGGDQDHAWAAHPERPAVIVGTQDMLLSRALMRGYGMSRFAWPIHFGLLHTDAMWVFDETQLMGVAVETSAQLEAFRRQLGTAIGSQSIWMSATLGDDQLDTVDHQKPDGGWSRHELNDRDHDHSNVRERLSATKTVVRAEPVVPKRSAKKAKKAHESYADHVAEAVCDAHVDGHLTLVIVNRVNRAQAIFEKLCDREGRDETNTALLHSRFRRVDRRAHEQMLHADGDRIVVSTQVIEAGVDVSARVMFTELAPWPSIVQRVGRCNRFGDFDDARVYWMDIEFKKDGDASLLPYGYEAMQEARQIVADLDDVGPAAVQSVPYEPDPVIRPVLRRKDLLELFDTTPDLSGNDLDVSRYIRESDDTDVLVYWRDWSDDHPPNDMPDARRTELCRVLIGRANDFVGKKGVDAWAWDALDGVWRTVVRVRPGQTILLAADQGGYHAALGWTGKKSDKPDPVTDFADDDETSDDEASDDEANDDKANDDELEDMDGNPGTDVGQWVALPTHLEHVAEAVDRLAGQLTLDADTVDSLVRAARWHDVGKAHHVFQNMLVEPARAARDLADPPGEKLWAKSNHRRRWKSPDRRPHFRHELASALAFMQTHDDEPDSDLIAYLIAAHHGKVRLSIRSLPGEREPDRAEADDLFARGVWHGDVLPPVEVPGEGVVELDKLDLRLMRLGRGSWLERTLALRDDPELGPFRLAWLESLLRLADHRASAAEKSAADTSISTDTSQEDR